MTERSTPPGLMLAALERVHRRCTATDDGCVVFDGAKSSKGYGYVRVDGRAVAVHRLAYTAAYGPIPAGWHVDHRCARRACVPDHWRLGVHRDRLLPSPPFGAAVRR